MAGKTEAILNIVNTVLGTAGSVIEMQNQQQQYSYLNQQYGYQYNPTMQDLQRENSYYKQQLMDASNLVRQKSNTIQQLLAERKAEQAEFIRLQEQNKQLIDALNQAREHILELQVTENAPESLDYIPEMSEDQLLKAQQ